ncbi:MAG: hypothetical protein ABII01_05555 [Candidatus Woesearchaeota archaeon]
MMQRILQDGIGGDRIGEKPERRRPEYNTIRGVYDHYADIGISRFTLRRVLNEVEARRFFGLERRVQAVADARVSVYGPERTRELLERVGSRAITELDDNLLEFYLTVKPVDAVYRMVDDCQNNPQIRYIKNVIDENRLWETFYGNIGKTRFIKGYRGIIDFDAKLVIGKITSIKINILKLRKDAQECIRYLEIIESQGHA